MRNYITSRLLILYTVLRSIDGQEYAKNAAPPARSNPYGRIRRHIFEEYDKSVRPVLNASHCTNVTISLRLYNLIDVNEAQESVEMLQWLHLTWIDEQLFWNPGDFEGIDMITVPYRQLWVPDISYQELVQGLMYPLDDANTYAHLEHSGRVSVVVSVVVRVHCRLNVAEFPFDTQSCEFTVAPWFHSAPEVDVRVDEVRFNNTHVLENSEFIVHSVTGRHILVLYDEGPPFAETKWMVVLERKPMYYIVVLFMPTYLITALCMVGLFSPSNANMEREEKCSMGATALLTMAVILLMVAELMPKSATQFPRLGRFIIVEMIMTLLGTLGAGSIMYLNCQAAFGVKVPRVLLITVGLYTYNKRRRPSRYFTCPQDEMDKASIPNSLPPLRTTYVSLPSRQALLMLHDVRQRLQRMQDRLVDYECQKQLVDLWARVCYRLDVAAMIFFNVTNTLLLAKFIMF